MADPTPISLTRQDLYDRVWSTPVWKLAQELGLSGRGLGKLCGREGIPVPKRGYWAKKAAGWNPTQAKLPARNVNQSAVITFQPERQRDAQASQKLKRQSLPEVPVQEILDTPHKLVKRTATAYRRGKVDSNGLLQRTAYDAIGLPVAPHSLDRSLRICDGLFQHLERNGAKVRVSTELGHATEIVLGDVVLELRVDEPLKRSDRELTPDQKKKKARGEYFYAERYSYTPKGGLRLRLHDREFGRDRGKWVDTRKPLETRLGEVVAGINAAADAVREARVSREEERIRREEDQRRAWIATQKRELEETRRQAFNKLADAWEQSRRTTAFTSALRSEAERLGVDCSSSSRFGRWLAWAERYSADANPLNWKLEALPNVHRSSWVPEDPYQDNDQT